MSGATAGVDKFLEPHRARLRPLVCWYQDATLLGTRAFPGEALEMPGSRWELRVKAEAVSNEPDACDVAVNLALMAGVSSASGLAVAFDFPDWNPQNYVLIPGAVYNGNRFRTVGRAYAEGLDPADYYRRDLPLTQTSVPRLETELGRPSKLEVGACNVTSPAICVLDHQTKRGLIVLAEQAGRRSDGSWVRNGAGEILDNAFAVEESLDRARATLVVSAPGVRERKPEFIGFSPSPDRALDWKAGDTIEMRLRVYSFPAADIPALLERFMTVRKSLTGPNQPRDLAPASQVAEWMTQRIESRFLKLPSGEGFYCPENGPWIAFGWIGGWMNTFPMLLLNDEARLARVSQTFDYGLKAQEPCGYFHYAIREDGNVSFRDPAPDTNLARTSGDMLFWMLKQFYLLKAQNRSAAIKPTWENSMRRLADALVTTWHREGQWGKLINVKTGAVAEYNTTGGASVIGALALASEYFQHPDYLRVAAESARYYYVRDFVRLGQTTGACADILQNAESETAAGFMTSLMTLYEITGESAWLEMSRNLANLTATWAVSYDYELPKATELGALGARLTGVYWASTQNKHGAPGICTTSGDALFKLYRATGDRRYAELLHDIIHAHRESIRPGGFTNERLTYCDADSRGSRGEHVTGWNELNGALMAAEIPGIYLRTDTDRFFVFDSVEARVIERAPDAVRLEIKNPTQFDANVTVFAEDGDRARKPTGWTALLGWTAFPVRAGEVRQVELRH